MLRGLVPGGNICTYAAIQPDDPYTIARPVPVPHRRMLSTEYLRHINLWPLPADCTRSAVHEPVAECPALCEHPSPAQGSGARAHIVGHRMGEQRDSAAQVGHPKRPRQALSRAAGGEASTGTMSALGGLARGEPPARGLEPVRKLGCCCFWCCSTPARPDMHAFGGGVHAYWVQSSPCLPATGLHAHHVHGPEDAAHVSWRSPVKGTHLSCAL